MKVRIYKTIKDVDEKEWDAIVGHDRLICTYRYLEAIEKSRINDTRYYYPVVYEGEEIVAHTSVYFISTELDTFARGSIKKIITAIRRKWKGFLILRSLECGTPVALGNTISFRRGISQKDVLRRLIQAIERLAEEIHVKVVLVRDFHDHELSLFDYLIELGYVRIHNLPNTKLEIRWKNFDEYLNAMRSNYKRKVIKRMEKCSKGNVTFELIKNFSGYADDLERLWVNIYKNAKEYTRERLTSVFFRNIDRYLGDKSGIILAKKDGIPLGFSLLLFDEQTLISMFFGLDYKYNKEYYIYFNLYYKMIKLAVKEGFKNIDMGITTLIPKKDVGAVVVTLNMYMKHFNPFLNKIIPKVFDWMASREETGSREVFKTARERNVTREVHI